MIVLFEDEFLLAAEKKSKQFVHPMSGEKDSKDCLLFHVRDYLGAHVYAINRLDRPVSGIVLFAKSPAVVRDFQNIWHHEETHKKYLCLHRGKLETPGVFDSPLTKRGAYKMVDKEIKQQAQTLYWPLHHFEKEYCTLTKVEIKTGRYHQIRRHFRKAVMPIIGDRKHGKGGINHHFEKNYCLNQIFLHSYLLQLNHPLTQKPLLIRSELPQNLRNVLERLGQRVIKF